MNDEEIIKSYERDGFVIVKEIIDDHELDGIRNIIETDVDEYAKHQYEQGSISSLHEEKSFTRRYAAICEELNISPRDWIGQNYGPVFYALYNLPGVLRIIGLILGPEVSNIGRPALRTKLPGSVVTSFPWHQDSQYFDQSIIGKKERHTEHSCMVTVWVPLVPATLENGCCWVLPGSHRWGLLDGVRGQDNNVRMEENVESRSNPTPLPLNPGGAIFFSNLCVHTSKLNKTKNCRWSIDFRYFPTPWLSNLNKEQRLAAEFMQTKTQSEGREPLVVLTAGRKPSWEEWDEANTKLQTELTS